MMEGIQNYPDFHGIILHNIFCSKLHLDFKTLKNTKDCKKFQLSKLKINKVNHGNHCLLNQLCENIEKNVKPV